MLEPSQSTENVSYTSRMQQAIQDWLLSPNMWPVGYIIGSPYSPFRVEQELPKRDWRDAFEDLLALESGSEMISHQSRKQEGIVAASLGWERASDCIQKLNKLNIRDAQRFTLARTALNKAKSPEDQADPSIISGLERMMNEIREMTQRRIAIAETFKLREESRGKFSTGRTKDRGQWITSLITSGALIGWTSLLKDSAHGNYIVLESEAEPQASVAFTERELGAHFEDDEPLDQESPGPPLYEVSNLPPAVQGDSQPFIVEHSSPQSGAWLPLIMSRVPERPYFWAQKTTAERIALPDGTTATKVLMKNYLTNGDFEEKVMIQEPGKVLQEVEKARALIHDRMLGFDKPINEAI